MKAVNARFLAAATLGLAVAAQAATAQSVTVATLEWPPYTSESLPGGGFTTEVVRQAFEAAGIEVNVETPGWREAIAMARGSGAVAYFPGYHCRHVDDFVPSEPIGSGRLGFAEHVNAPVSWLDVDDIGLQNLIVGTVSGFANTDEFDQKAGTGWIRAVPAPDDVTNLRKLGEQIIDMAVIDDQVLGYLLATDLTLEPYAANIVFDERALDDKLLYLCFNDDDEGRALRDRFNQGLAQLDVDQIVEAYTVTNFTIVSDAPAPAPEAAEEPAEVSDELRALTSLIVQELGGTSGEAEAGTGAEEAPAADDAMRAMTSDVLSGLGIQPAEPTPDEPLGADALQAAIEKAIEEGQSNEFIASILTEAVTSGGFDVPELRAALDAVADTRPARTIAPEARPTPEVAAATGTEAAPAEDEVEFYVVQAGDSLSLIADRLYGDAGAYTRIFEANTDTLSSPNRIAVGQRLVIPR